MRLANQGFAGGDGGPGGNGGGGGGAGAASVGVTGGVGVSSSITGTAVFRAGGGAGAGATGGQGSTNAGGGGQADASNAVKGQVILRFPKTKLFPTTLTGGGAILGATHWVITFDNSGTFGWA